MPSSNFYSNLWHWDDYSISKESRSYQYILESPNCQSPRIREDITFSTDVGTVERWMTWKGRCPSCNSEHGWMSWRQMLLLSNLHFHSQQIYFFFSITPASTSWYLPCVCPSIFESNHSEIKICDDGLPLDLETWHSSSVSHSLLAITSE